MSAKIKAKEFCEKVELLEGVVMHLWTDENTLVDDYEYQKKAANSISIADWLESRVKPKIGNTTVRIVDGKHSSPHRGQRMDTLRNSYLSGE
jgi:hypothetical protein